MYSLLRLSCFRLLISFLKSWLSRSCYWKLFSSLLKASVFSRSCCSVSFTFSMSCLFSSWNLYSCFFWSATTWSSSLTLLSSSFSRLWWVYCMLYWIDWRWRVYEECALSEFRASMCLFFLSSSRVREATLSSLAWFSFSRVLMVRIQPIRRSSKDLYFSNSIRLVSPLWENPVLEDSLVGERL